MLLLAPPTIRQFPYLLSSSCFDLQEEHKKTKHIISSARNNIQFKAADPSSEPPAVTVQSCDRTGHCVCQRNNCHVLHRFGSHGDDLCHDSSFNFVIVL